MPAPLRILLSFVIGHSSWVICAAASLDLAKYPRASELTLADLPADVQPVRSLRVKSPIDGLLTLRLPSDSGTHLPSGAVWGEFDPERLQLEGDALELARTLLKEKESPKLALELARSAAELAERRAELARQSDMLARIAADPSLAELYADESAGATSGEEVSAVVARLRAQLVLIDEVLRHAGTPRENELEQRALDLKLRAQELEHARRLRDLRLSMPFDGEIALVVAPSPDGKPFRVPLGAELAIIRDFSSIEARVAIRRAEWRMFSPTRLQLRYTHRGRAGIAADYRRSLHVETSGREELFYVFRFPEPHRADARPLAGGQVVMQLVLSLEQPAVIIPKIDLILAVPAAFRDGGWDAGVSAALPGARLVALGETHLAVAAP